MPALKMNALTTEYVHVGVTSTGGLLGYPVSLAAVPVGTKPADGDWRDGSWDTSVTTSPFRARLLVGPDGAVALEAGSSYDLWIKIEDNPEIPVRKSGTIVVS